VTLKELPLPRKLNVVWLSLSFFTPVGLLKQAGTYFDTYVNNLVVSKEKDVFEYGNTSLIALVIKITYFISFKLLNIYRLFYFIHNLHFLIFHTLIKILIMSQ